MVVLCFTEYPCTVYLGLGIEKGCPVDRVGLFDKGFDGNEETWLENQVDQVCERAFKLYGGIGSKSSCFCNSDAVLIKASRKVS